MAHEGSWEKEEVEATEGPLKAVLLRCSLRDEEGAARGGAFQAEGTT